MTFFKRNLGATLIATTALCGQAFAQDMFSVNGELTGADPTFNRVDINTCCNGSGNGVTYDAYQVTVTDASLYSFVVTLTGLSDSFLNLFTPAFDPTNAAASIVEGDDDAGAGLASALTAAANPIANGEYVLVVTSFSAGQLGTYTLDAVGAVLGWVAASAGPGVAAGLSSGASRLAVVDASGVVRDRGQESLATRDAALSFTRTSGEDGAPLVTMSANNMPGLSGEVFAWIELTGFFASDDVADRSLRGVGLQAGADIAIATDMVAGLSVGATNIDTNSAGTAIEGTLIYLQPYLAYTAGDWHGEASIIYGRGDFDQSGVGGVGTGETELRALTFTGGYDMPMGAGQVLTPTIGLAVGREEMTGTGGAVTGTSEVDFAQASLGARFTQSVSGGEVFAGVHVDYQTADSDTVLAGDILINDGYTGRLEFGGAWELANGNGLDLGVEVGGLGGDLNEVSGALRATFRF